jgi:hypothetical protein
MGQFLVCPPQNVFPTCPGDLPRSFGAAASSWFARAAAVLRLKPIGAAGVARNSSGWPSFRSLKLTRLVIGVTSSKREESS